LPHIGGHPPLSAPELPPPPTRDDAEYLVARFLSAWGWSETYLSPMATQDVVDRCRDGVGGCPRLGGGTYQDGKPDEVIGTTQGTYEVHSSFVRATAPTSHSVFVVGPGTAADRSEADLIVLDVATG
jgi:hypothetical protein